MRRTSVLLLLVLLTLPALWGSGAAVAGGPTSVLLSAPGEGRVAALYHTDAAYQALDELGAELNADTGTASSPPAGGAGEVVTLTWLIHDVQVWKVDRVHLGGKGAPWVETRTVYDEGSVWDVSASWHRANPKLRNLLDEVLSDAGAATVAPLVAEADDVAATPVPGADAVDGWSSAAVAAGAGVGVVAGVLLTLVALRRRLRPEPLGTEQAAPAAVTDQLAWP
jgi:hypothetical protein